MFAITLLAICSSAFSVYMANYVHKEKEKHRKEYDIIRNNRKASGEFVSAKPSQHTKGSVCNYHYFVHQKEYLSEVVVDNKEVLKDSVTLFYDPLHPEYIVTGYFRKRKNIEAAKRAVPFILLVLAVLIMMHDKTAYMITFPVIFLSYFFTYFFLFEKIKNKKTEGKIVKVEKIHFVDGKMYYDYRCSQKNDNNNEVIISSSKEQREEDKVLLRKDTYMGELV